MAARIAINQQALARFCAKWNIEEFALFGSVLREDFGPESDVDVLVRFSKSSRPTLFDLHQMQEELSQIFGREVDLVTRRGVESCRNEARRAAILSSAEVIHAG